MLTGFYIGADNYISKPFSLQEVLARVRAILRRKPKDISKETRHNETIHIGSLYIDFKQKTTKIDEEEIHLTKTEFGILELLTKHPQTIFSRSDIISFIWPNDTYITERTVDVHITRLRKKLGSYSSLIANRSGFGYVFNQT